MTDQKIDSADELLALLPWYANGKLNDDERARLESALSTDPALRASFERIVEERYETTLVNESVPPPRTGGIDALLARIEDEAPRRDRTAQAGWFKRLFGASWGPRVAALAGVAAALVIFAESGALIDLLVRAPSDNGPYVIASVQPPNAADLRVLLVAFADGADVGAVNKLLRANQASIIEGPLAGGLFRIAVASASADAILADLKAHPELVRFAGLGK